MLGESSENQLGQAKKKVDKIFEILRENPSSAPERGQPLYTSFFKIPPPSRKS